MATDASEPRATHTYIPHTRSAHALVKVKLASTRVDVGAAAAALAEGSGGAFVTAKGQTLLFARDEASLRAAAEAGAAEAQAKQAGKGHRKAKLFIGGVPHGMTAAELEHKIRPAAGGPDAPLVLELPLDGEGRNRGHALLTVASQAAAEAVIFALDGVDAGAGRSFTVRPDGARKRGKR